MLITAMSSQPTIAFLGPDHQASHMVILHVNVFGSQAQ